MSNSPYQFEANQENFSSKVLEASQQQPIVVDFWAPWCAPCRSLMPLLETLAEEFQGKFLLAKLNSDQQRELVSQYQIRSLPTVKLFKNGEVVDEFLGAQGEQVIRAMLNRHVERESDKWRVQARTLITQQKTAEALALLIQAHADDNSNQNVTFDLTELYVSLNRFDEAEATLKTLSLEFTAKPEVAALNARLRLARAAALALPLAVSWKMLKENPNDLDALYALGAHALTQRDYTTAMQNLLFLIQKSPQYKDGLARTTLVDTFNLLGAAHPLVQEYRRKLARVLH